MPAQLERDWGRFALGKSPTVLAAGGVINISVPCVLISP